MLLGTWIFLLGSIYKQNPSSQARRAAFIRETTFGSSIKVAGINRIFNRCTSNFEHDRGLRSIRDGPTESWPT